MYKGFNIVLETIPLNGQLVVRTAVQESNQTQTPEDMGP